MVIWMNQQEVDIVLIGGGPVGLWTAIQLKKRLPGCRVKIFEKHEKYQRSHILRLDQSSLIAYCKKAGSKDEQNLLDSLVGSKKRKYKIPTKSVFIRTNELEQALRECAISLGVEIETRTIQSPEEASDLCPSARYFIAADGSHSHMRKLLLGDFSTKKNTLQNIVEIKYETINRTHKIATLRDAYKTIKILKSLAFEYIGRPNDDGRTPITLRFFVDSKTYDEIPLASFKNPLKFEDQQIPSGLASDIHTYLNVRKRLTGEEYLKESIRITKINLDVYRSKRFAIRHNGKIWFIVGDAAMGVPYFRAMNCGFLCGSLLAWICEKSFSKKREFLAIFAYEYFARMRFKTEWTLAYTKNFFLNIFNEFRRLSSKVPWQTIKWSSDEAFEYQTQEHFSSGSE